MSSLERAQSAYGEDLPDWVEQLAIEADRTSQKRVSERLGYTVGAVNAVLGKKYKADTSAIETRVRGILMSDKIICPMLGEIGPHKCRDWRDRQRRGMAANSLHIRMAAACRTCSRNESPATGRCAS